MILFTTEVSGKNGVSGISLLVWYTLLIKGRHYYPGWCGSVDWVMACEPKGHWFDSQSGLWATSAVGGVWEAMDISCTLEFLSLSFSLPSFLSKNKYIKSFFLKKTLLMKEENSYEWFENGKDSFWHIGRNDVNLNVLNFELDINRFTKMQFGATFIFIS